MIKRNRIEAAYWRLDIQNRDQKEVQDRLAAMVDEMASMSASAKINPAFAVVGREATKKELQTLAKKCNALTGCLASLHAPAIGALANRGFVDRHALLILAEQLSNAVDSTLNTDLSEIPAKQGSGRHPDYLARGVARILAHEFHTLTGDNPTITVNSYAAGNTAGGPFLDLVTGIFGVLGITASPETFARQAISFRTENRAHMDGVQLKEETTQKETE